MNSSNLKVGSPPVQPNDHYYLESLSSESSLGSPSQPPKLNKTSSDRFIPSRIASNLHNLFFKEIELDEEKEKKNKNKQTTNPENYRDELNSKQYENLLQTQILALSDCENISKSSNVEPKTKKIFKFNSDRKNIENLNPYSAFLNYPQNIVEPLNPKPERKISKQPYKILDAPNLQDDFYLNLLDWSGANFIAIGLETELYMWSACNSKVTKLCEVPENDSICSVAWSALHSNQLAMGNNFGEIHLYDAAKEGHEGRVGSLSWNGNLLASGSRDRSILVRDIRDPKSSLQKYTGHKQEICGLKWSYCEQLLASGGNDNKLFVWSLKNQGELTHFGSHTAAVKAIGWSPHQHNILASGGGTADRTIRFWNTHSLTQADCIDTGSQVCNLLFSPTVNEIISTHGYSLNQIIVWKYPTMEKLATLTGHTLRVLYLAKSPDGQNIVTGAGDETLRFWSVFPSFKTKNEGFYATGKSNLFPSSMDLR